MLINILFTRFFYFLPKFSENVRLSAESEQREFLIFLHSVINLIIKYKKQQVTVNLCKSLNYNLKMYNFKNTLRSKSLMC